VASALAACTTGLDAREENSPTAFSADAVGVGDSLPAAPSQAYLRARPAAAPSAAGACWRSKQARQRARSMGAGRRPPARAAGRAPVQGLVGAAAAREDLAAVAGPVGGAAVDGLPGGVGRVERRRVEHLQCARALRGCAGRPRRASRGAPSL